jgi:hypothetical protein
VTPVDGRPVVDAILDALRTLPGYWVGEVEGPTVPAQSCPALVVFVDPGVVGGYPYAPGRDLTQSVALKGIGLTPEQAMRAAIDGRDLLLSGVVTVTGRRVLFTASETQQPFPLRDASLTPAVFSQLALLDLRN